MSHSNTALTEQESGWVEEFAGRLQLIRVDTAAATTQQRREYLQEEVARGLKSIPPASHKRYLEALLARFPVAGQVASSAPAAPMPAPTPVAAQSPEQALESFLALLAASSKEKQNELAGRLFGSEIVGAYLKVLVLEFPPELRRDLGLAEGQQPNAERLAQLDVLLIEFLCNLDQMALTALKEMARREVIKPRDDFRKAAARFLTAENESMEPQFKAISILLGSLLRGMLAIGNVFGRECQERFSPEAIEEIVEAEGRGGGFMGMVGKSKKERCWDKYKELAKDFITPELIERRIRDSLADYVEKKVRGGR